MHLMLRPIVFVSLVFCLLTLSTPAAHGQEVTLTLAEDGKTSYVIVKPEQPSAVDEYAIEKLAGYLKQMTHADFEVVSPEKVTADGRYIFVGMSRPVHSRLGEGLVKHLAAQEHVSRSKEHDVFLYGQGVHGNLSAVFEFLENSTGWRWYSVFCEPVAPEHVTLVLSSFNRKRRFDFTSRQTGLRFGLDFYYQNGFNQGYFSYQKNRHNRFDTPIDPAYQSFLPSTNFVHTAMSYIPPDPKAKYANEFPWLQKRNYFETHPEYFSLDENGKRVASKQLCFSNAGLRAEFTRNVILDIQHNQASAPQGLIVTVDAADTPGAFCFCADCQALEKKYQSPGGPLYDYVIELCNTLAKDYPSVFVRILAYRTSQTQKPPALEQGKRLPENLIVSFAPIEDNYFGDWNHPDPALQETFGDLKNWGKITTHLWAWIYPNPWGSGAILPVGNVQRMITNIRLMHQAGVTGLFADHNGFITRSGLSELQNYLLLKLMQDVNADTDAVTTEVTDYLYGQAGQGVRTYINELEAGRLAMETLPDDVRFKSSRYDDETFPYLTAQNVHRWEVMFDDMLKQLPKGSFHHDNLLILRRELDMAALNEWFAFKDVYPDYFADYQPVAERLRQANTIKPPLGVKLKPHGDTILDNMLLRLDAGGKEKPLPEQFDGVDPKRIRTFLPVTQRNRTQPRKDADAPFGYAPRVDGLSLPFDCGFHVWISRNPKQGKSGPRLKLNTDQITPGQYKLYKLGSIDVETSDALIWFGKSWATNLSLGDLVHTPGENNEWDAWVSLKFDGPLYGGTAAEDEVLVGRIILVKTGANP